MKRTVWSDLFVALVVLFLAPIVIIYGCIAALWLMVLAPLIIIGFVLYSWIRKQEWCFWMKKRIPRYTKPRVKKNPILVNWFGKKVPLLVLITSMILSVVFVIVLIYCMLLVFPTWISVLIIGILIGKSMHKKKK